MANYNVVEFVIGGGILVREYQNTKGSPSLVGRKEIKLTADEIKELEKADYSKSVISKIAKKHDKELSI